MFKKLKTPYFLGLFIGMFVAASVVSAVEIINNYGYEGENGVEVVNNYYLGQAEPGEEGLGAVEAVGGICNGSEPVTQMCNINVYEIESQTGITAADGTFSDALTVSGASDVSTFTQGGGITASSTTNAAETLLATDIDVENVITYTPNVNSTLTLPATSTLSAIIPTAGDTRQYFIQNASSTETATLTLAGGTGMDMQEPTGADLVINGLDWGILNFVRLANTDIAVFFNEFQEAD